MVLKIKTYSIRLDSFCRSLKSRSITDTIRLISSLFNVGNSDGRDREGLSISKLYFGSINLLYSFFRKCILVNKTLYTRSVFSSTIQKE